MHTSDLCNLGTLDVTALAKVFTDWEIWIIVSFNFYFDKACLKGEISHRAISMSYWEWSTTMYELPTSTPFVILGLGRILPPVSCCILDSFQRILQCCFVACISTTQFCSAGQQKCGSSQFPSPSGLHHVKHSEQRKLPCNYVFASFMNRLYFLEG